MGTEVVGNQPKLNFYETVRREMRLRNYSPKTIKSYISSIRSFVSYFRPKHPRELTQPEIKSYLLYLIEDKKMSAGSVNQAFNALRLLYAELYEMPFVIGKLPRPAREKKLPDVLNEEEVLLLFKAVPNLKHRAMLMLAYASGLRVGELVKLKVEDFDSERNIIHIRGGKGKKDRYTLLPESLREILHRYWREYNPGHSGWFFRGSKNDQHLSIRSIQHVFEKAIDRAGIKKPVSMHTLRHSFATHLLEHGTDLRYIQALLGHESLKTTEIYTHVSTQKIGAIKSPLDFIGNALNLKDNADKKILNEG